MHVIALAALLGTPSFAADIEVTDGRAETLLAALEDPNNAGKSVAVSGSYVLNHGVALQTDMKLIGVADDRGIPPTISVGMPDGIVPGDCRSVICAKPGNVIKSVNVSVDIDALDLPERMGNFAGIHITDDIDGQVVLRDVVVARAIGTGISVIGRRHHADYEVKATHIAILTVIDNLTLISICGVSFVNYADWALTDIKISEALITGVEVGVSVRAEGSLGSQMHTRIVGTDIDASLTGVAGTTASTEVVGLNVEGLDIEVTGFTVAGVALNPFEDGAVDNSIDVVFKDSTWEGAGGREEDLLIGGPTDGGTYLNNDVRVRYRRMEAGQVDLSVPYVEGNRTSVTLGRLPAE